MSQSKWQPVMLIVPERLECSGHNEQRCGALAIFVCLFPPEQDAENEEKRDMDYKAYCQQCFGKAQQEEEE